MNNLQSNGVIYIVTGENCSYEACQSATSLKRHNPDLSITIFTDQQVKEDCFERVIPITSYLYNSCRQSAKLSYLAQSPYQNTLYIDSDTYICDDIRELFMLLEKFDLAAAHASQRWGVEYTVDNIPDCFPEFNCGILLFKKSPQIEEFFTTWLSLYQRDLKRNLVSNYLPDQPTFREAIYHSNLRVATLTPEYNCRFVQSGFVNKAVKILHGRHFNLSSIAKTINMDNKRRIHYMGIEGSLKIVKHQQDLTQVKQYIRFRQSLQQRGWRETFILVLKEVFRK